MSDQNKVNTRKAIPEFEGIFSPAILTEIDFGYLLDGPEKDGVSFMDRKTKQFKLEEYMKCTFDSERTANPIENMVDFDVEAKIMLSVQDANTGLVPDEIDKSFEEIIFNTYGVPLCWELRDFNPDNLLNQQHEAITSSYKQHAEIHPNGPSLGSILANIKTRQLCDSARFYNWLVASILDKYVMLTPDDDADEGYNTRSDIMTHGARIVVDLISDSFKVNKKDATSFLCISVRFPCGIEVLHAIDLRKKSHVLGILDAILYEKLNLTDQERISRVIQENLDYFYSFIFTLAFKHVDSLVKAEKALDFLSKNSPNNH